MEQTGKAATASTPACSSGSVLGVPGGRLLVASDAGDGFVAPEDEILAQMRAGKQVLNLRAPVQAAVCRPVAGDHVAVVGENRKVRVFALDELPVMARGKGVRLQRYKDGGPSDAVTFRLDAGLSWLDLRGPHPDRRPRGTRWLARQAYWRQSHTAAWLLAGSEVCVNSR